MITLTRQGKRKNTLLAVMDHVDIYTTKTGVAIVTRTHEATEFSLDIPTWQLDSVIERLQRLKLILDNRNKSAEKEPTQ